MQRIGQTLRQWMNSGWWQSRSGKWLKGLLGYPAFSISLGLLVVASLVVLSLAAPFRAADPQGFQENILVEAHGLLFDLIALGVLASIFSYIAERRSKIDRYNEEIDDFRYWEDKEATFRIAGNIRRLNRDSEVPRDLSQVFLQNAALSEALLAGATLFRATLEGADLRGANLQAATLEGANVQGVNLQGANLQAARLDGAILDRARMKEVNLRGASLQGATLDKAILQGADLQGAIFAGANLEGADLFSATLDGASLQGANLQGAIMAWTSLQAASLLRANLTGASLREANLTGANLQGSMLEGATLKGATLQGARYNSQEITGSAGTVPPTRWPAGFNPRQQGAIDVSSLKKQREERPR